MARDFRSPFESPGVPRSPGDILETEERCASPAAGVQSPPAPSGLLLAGSFPAAEAVRMHQCDLGPVEEGHANLSAEQLFLLDDLELSGQIKLPQPWAYRRTGQSGLLEPYFEASQTTRCRVEEIVGLRTRKRRATSLTSRAS